MVFADLYSLVTNDNASDLDQDHIHINTCVHNKVSEHKGLVEHKDFEDVSINVAILSLRKNVSQGADGITAEHFM